MLSSLLKWNLLLPSNYMLQGFDKRIVKEGKCKPEVNRMKGNVL